MILVYSLSNSSNCDDLECLLKVISLLQAFSGAIFHICGMLRRPAASAELLVCIYFV